MKQYKLIKEYPGCTGIGQIVQLFGDVYKNNKNSGGYYVKCQIEDYPEFWQEIGTDKKYLSDYRGTIGSVHWFNTLLGQAKSCAEYIKAHSKEERTVKYGTQIFEILTDFVIAHKEGLVKTNK